MLKENWANLSVKNSQPKAYKNSQPEYLGCHENV